MILTLDLRFGASENVIVKPRAGVSHTAISRGREIQGVCPQVSLEEVQLKIPKNYYFVVSVFDYSVCEIY